MSVRNRLLLTFGLVVAIFVVPAFYATERLGELRNMAVESRARHAGTAVTLGEIQNSATQVAQLLLSYIYSPDRYEERLDRAIASLRAAADTLDSSGYGAEAAPLTLELDSLMAAAVQGMQMVREGRLDPAVERAEMANERLRAVRREVAAVASAVDLRASEDFARADAISSAGREAVIIATGVALALAGLLGLWTTRGLAGPLERLRRAMADVADEAGFIPPPDLPYDRNDEIGAVSDSFRTMTLRLGELDRLKVEFLGVASHELKTPINVMRGYAELIEEELGGDLTEYQAGLLQQIGAQAQSMSRMVSRLMDISRLESGSFGMEPEEVLVEDILVGLERRFEILATQRGIDFRVSRDPGSPERLEVDVDLVRDEVLGNLVSNALKFTPERGTVRVEATGREGGVLFRVSDTGPGIPEEHRPYVFERYYRVERTRGLGTGLGLAISRQVAEIHGGWVRLADGDGPGATFLVFLPVPA